MTTAAAIFTPDYLDEIFPLSRTNDFFDALFGDSEEGAYNIRLRFDGQRGQELHFAFHLQQRPAMCLACNLTYGLPQVFSRHPVLAVGQVAQTLSDRMGHATCTWALGNTREISRSLHSIPFIITLG